MAEAISMPRLGQSVETCIITKWFKNQGDYVKEGDLLFSYETDKAAFEETANISGTILDIFYEEGDEVPVLATVAVIGIQGESIQDFSPEAKRSEEKRLNEKNPADKIKKEYSDIIQNFPPHKNKKIRISPRARNMAAELGIDPESLSGTGPNERIIARDVEREILSGKSQKTDKSHKNASVKVTTTNDYIITPLSSLRKIIAAAMLSSLQNSAQLTHHMGADARKILALREKIKKEQETGNMPNITLNDMVCFALIRALTKMPLINSHFTDNSIKTFTKIHLGIAVDTDRGLMVPVIKNADDYSLRGLSGQIQIMSEACRKGTIEPDLLKSEAASFTISNLGSYGVELFTPVLNPPQAGILGVNTITYRPADTGGGVIGFIPFIGLSLTYDHRVLDGAPASAFLREIKHQIEQIDDTLL